MEFQSSQNKQNNRTFSKKIRRGPDLPGLGRNCADPAQIYRRRAGDDFKRPASAPSDRIGTRRSRPSDQVTIDGDRSSSPRQKRGRRWGLGFGRGLTGAHLGWPGVDLAVAFGCGSLEKGSAMSSERRASKWWGPRLPPSPPDAPARSAMASATVGLGPGKV
jgi:hypothetical protein